METVAVYFKALALHCPREQCMGVKVHVTHYHPRHLNQISGQLHAPADLLPSKEFPVPIVGITADVHVLVKRKNLMTEAEPRVNTVRNQIGKGTAYLTRPNKCFSSTNPATGPITVT